MRIVLIFILYFLCNVNFLHAQEGKDVCKNDDPVLDPSLALFYINGTLETRRQIETRSLRSLKEFLRYKDIDDLKIEEVCLTYGYNQTDNYVEHFETYGAALEQAYGKEGEEFNWIQVGAIAIYGIEEILDGELLTAPIMKKRFPEFSKLPAIIQLITPIIQTIIGSYYNVEYSKNLSYMAKESIMPILNNRPVLFISNEQGTLFNSGLYNYLIDEQLEDRDLISNHSASLLVSPLNLRGTLSNHMKHHDYLRTNNDYATSPLILYGLLDGLNYLGSKTFFVNYFQFSETENNFNVFGDNSRLPSYMSPTLQGSEDSQLLTNLDNLIYYNKVTGIVDIQNLQFGTIEQIPYDSLNFKPMEKYFYEKLDRLAETLLRGRCEEFNKSSLEIEELKLKPYVNSKSYFDTLVNDYDDFQVSLDVIDIENGEFKSDLLKFVKIYSYNETTNKYKFIADYEDFDEFLEDPRIQSSEGEIVFFLNTRDKDFPHEDYPDLPKLSCVKYETGFITLKHRSAWPEVVNQNVGLIPAASNGELVVATDESYAPYTKYGNVFANDSLKEFKVNGKDVGEEYFFEGSEIFSDGVYFFGEASAKTVTETTWEYSSLITRSEFTFEMKPVPNVTIETSQNGIRLGLYISVGDNNFRPKFRASLEPMGAPFWEYSTGDNLVYCSKLPSEGINYYFRQTYHNYAFEDAHEVFMDCDESQL